MIALNTNSRTITLPGRKKPVAGRIRARITASQRRLLNRILAATAAGFLPVGSYVLAHIEAPQSPWLWSLVAGGLLYSAPTLAEWSAKWTRSAWKSWGFTLLLEGVLVGSHILPLNMSALVILTAINAAFAFDRAR